MSLFLARNKLSVYLRLMRADKPIGALLLLWPTLWALWIAAAGKEARCLFGVLVLLSFLVATTLNSLTVVLSVVASVLACAYPFAKRYTHLPQVVLARRSAGRSRWLSPPRADPCRRFAGSCSSPTSCGSSRTTRSTPLSTGTTI
ncbi:hypothetical protein GCM10027598_12160 [Amycolatopsis oliviviridis]|nr:UbiA family prenyltransferase [Amycolatopsis oliviviridis]